jgi:hypothetical protein
MSRRINRAEDVLPAFAKRVNATAKRMIARGVGNFGDDKVFTHAVWAVGKFDLTLPDFKEMLLHAHKARLLTLSRADLVEAMDPYDVKRSLITNGGAEYNFIRV